MKNVTTRIFVKGVSETQILFCVVHYDFMFKEPIQQLHCLFRFISISFQAHLDLGDSLENIH
jgi:hypothetical protein